MHLPLVILLMPILACSSPPGEAPPETPPAEAGRGSSTPGELPTNLPSNLPERVAIRHILVAWDGAHAAPLGTHLSRDKARTRAKEILVELKAGADMAVLAKRYSTDGSAQRGGFLGSSDPDGWVPEFSKAAFSLNINALSDVVETPFGFHILRREPLQEVRLLHLVVQYEGARAMSDQAKIAMRPKDAALERAGEALSALGAGQSFEAVAELYSDGPMGVRGADLGWFTRGEIGPAFDEAVFSLETGGTSQIIESPFGFHIVKRTE